MPRDMNRLSLNRVYSVIISGRNAVYGGRCYGSEHIFRTGNKNCRRF